MKAFMFQIGPEAVMQNYWSWTDTLAQNVFYSVQKIFLLLYNFKSYLYSILHCCNKGLLICILICWVIPMRTVQPLTCSHPQRLVLPVSEYVGLKQTKAHCWKLFVQAHIHTQPCSPTGTQWSASLFSLVDERTVARGRAKRAKIIHTQLNTTEK